MSCSGYRGTRAFLYLIKATNGLDDSQASSVYHTARRKARPRRTDPTVADWQEFVDAQTEELLHNRNLDDRQFNHLYRYFRSIREDAPPDAKTFAALKDLPLRAKKAESALRRQVDAVASFRGVSAEAARERFDAYRAQYQRDYRTLPADLRPDPPQEWVSGYRTKDMMAVSSPGDRATLYAMYRCQADPHAFAPDPALRFASIDLETAGPEGRDGFNPANGSIIEVGIVEHDYHGNETGRYSQLIRPHEAVAATCGTGAVHVHGITLDDVADAPAWHEVAPTVQSRLAGRVLLAQNARFENDWLSHHMHAEGQDFDRWGPAVDTMCIARQHLSTLDNHRLSTICERVGVAYTDGHRAEHDAAVAGQAFFKMRDQIHATYLANPHRAAAPQPAPGAGHRPARRSPIIRVTAGDYDPATVEDPWALPHPARVA